MSAALKERLRSANSVVVLTGAGVSAESGIPTFRGPGGLWRQFRPEDLATPEAFGKDPKLVWEWYDWRRSMVPQPLHLLTPTYKDLLEMSSQIYFTYNNKLSDVL